MSELDHAALFQQSVFEMMRGLLFQEITKRDYQRLLDTAVRVIPGAEAGSILLRHEDGKYHFAATVGYDDAELSDKTLDEHELHYGSSDQAGASYVVFNLDDMTTNPDEVHNHKNVKDTSVSLTIPIRQNDKVVAVFSLDSAEGDLKFSSESRKIAEAFAAQVSVVFQHLRLKEGAEQRTHELTLLDSLRTAIARELSFDQLIKKSVDAITELFPQSKVSCYVQKDGGLVFLHGSGQQDMYPRSVSNQQGLMAKVLETKQAEFALVEEPEATALQDRVFAIAVPLFDRRQIVGVLHIERAKGDLSKHDYQLTVMLSEQINVAIERVKLFETSKDNELRFRLLAENMSDVVCLHEADGRYVYVSPSSLASFGYDEEDILGKYPSDFIHPDDVVIAKNHLRQLLRSQQTEAMSYRFKSKAGGHVWVETLMQPILGSDGRVRQIVSSSRDVTERKKVELELEHNALHDTLTGLPNRALFVKRLEHAIRRKQRDPRLRFALLFLDLDRFKIINDSLGHGAGDSLLVELGKRLDECIRATDMVARLGGDEFAILLEDLETNSEAKWAAERILRTMVKPFELSPRSVFTSASIGIAFITSASQSPQDLMRNADIAMYQAKNRGGESYVVFDSSMHEQAVEVLSFETDLRLAIERDELRLRYQPIYDLEKKHVTGFEVLLRWQHPDKGLISPDEFIALAEEVGLIIDIEQWVLSQACQQLASWQKDFPFSKDLYLSVNMSARHIMFGDQVRQIASLVKESGLTTANIKLEITENGIMDNAEKGAAVLSRLRAEGIGVYIDDFGTGYSSLSYLHKLPLDSLKIDRSFVRQMDYRRHEAEIVRTIIELAHSLGLDVIAEGIETRSQLERLAALGCSYGQGYLIAKPLSCDEVEERYLSGLKSAMSV